MTINYFFLFFSAIATLGMFFLHPRTGIGAVVIKLLSTFSHESLATPSEVTLASLFRTQDIFNCQFSFRKFGRGIFENILT